MTVKGSQSVSRFTLGIREVGCRNDDSEADGLIYITIRQHLRREGCCKRNGGWLAVKENKYQGPRRHYSLVFRVIVF